MLGFLLVRLLTGSGDELQSLKKGIIDLAYALAVNKSDGDTVQRAELAAAQYTGALHLFRHTSEHWDPPVITISALEARGMDRVWAVIEQHHAVLGASGELADKRRSQQQAWL